ncbi:ankyrin repeat domain-containing protein 54 isoform X1 [Strongylocentrotus purpuratus]|uniref:Ankyrin repeat domain-containing protein 54 n=1 Tax=Strongylocentrotus purpuratus TaxID=7668 RepID=A0A7M7GGB3_STRPU|nr:ankyrin repeat domain-containing protein 54 isoform X1 [Strongylocentrotus purpuratus]|eukprot:XP_003725433.1 PREDICTED: ankyrin repeat domain-containing protein 54 isoform X2 [Strongylocentrotus purpuratus]
MSDSAAEAGPSTSGGRMFMHAPPPVINIIAPTDSPSMNNNIEPGPSGDHHNQHRPLSSGDVLNNSHAATQDELPHDFQCDFGFLLRDKVSLSTLQVQQPIELDYADIPNNTELTNFIGKTKKRRLYCRRGAVVLQQSPVGRFYQAERKLRLAAQQGDYREVLKLLDEGINPNRGDDKGRTALHFAITKGFREIVQLLLDRGADVNQKDGIGNTPLHLAAIGSHISMVTTLLEAGANVQVLDRGGHTPFHLALSRLQHLRSNSSIQGIHFREEILTIMGMLRVYVSCRGQQENAMQLEQMSVKLRETEKKEEVGIDTACISCVDILQDMLEGFTKMNLTKQ